MENYPEVYIFYSDRNRYVSHERLTPGVVVNLLGEMFLTLNIKDYISNKQI